MARHGSLRRRRALVLAVATATALTACSSTNDKRADAPSGDEALAATAVPSPSASLLTGTNGKPLTKQQIVAAVKSGKLPKSALKYASAAPTSAGAGTTGGSTGGTATGTTGATVVRGPVGPGVSATEIKIGYSAFKVGDFAKQFGIDADPGDNAAQIKAVAAYVNAHGGVAGRKLIPSIYTVDFTKTNAQDGQFEAEACAKWTEDDKAFAVVNLSLNRPQFVPCIAKKDVIGIQQGTQLTESQMAPYKRWYYTTMAGSGVVQDRVARSEVKMLCAKGWFKGATVGVIYFDDPALRKVVDKEYGEGAKACGMKKIVLQAAGRGGTNPDAQFVARFQAEGVTHVMFQGEGGGYPNFFMPAAESQQYRPKYSLRSDMAPALTLQGIVSENQLKNATGIGWSPVQDVDVAHDPGPSNANDKLCLDIFRKASIDISNRGARLAAVGYCSGTLFIQQVLAKASTANSSEFARVVAGLAGAFVPPATFTNTFTASQHDGPSSYREIGWDAEKKGFRYAGGNQPMAAG
jgi:hypothetical protein